MNFAELGKTTATELNEPDKNVREVQVVDNQLYTSADPTQPGSLTIATVGSGLPTAKGQTLTNLPFETGQAPEEPYGYSLLTLGMGSTPDTLYVADARKGGETGAIVKYGLSGGKWVEHGSVEVPQVTGLTANDIGGQVVIYATSSGPSGKEGTLYRLSDVSGVNGTLSGVPEEIAKAPTNEAFRGVAFAPGTKIESGGTPPVSPTISTPENALPAAINDPTNKTMPITVEDSAYAANELTVTVASSKESVAAASGINVTGNGKERTLHVTPGEVGVTKLTITVEAPNGVFASTQLVYGVSAYLGSASDRYYSGAGSAATAIDVGGGYMVVAGDESNALYLYHERVSGPPLKTWNFSSQMPFGTESINIHSSARAGNTIYYLGGFNNTQGGAAEPQRNTIFDVRINGSGASTELSYAGVISGFARTSPNGTPSTAARWPSKPVPPPVSRASPPVGSRSRAWSSSQARLRKPTLRSAHRSSRPAKAKGSRDKALVIPITNFSSLFSGNPGTTHATFGTPLEWSMPNPNAEGSEEAAGLSIRQIRANGEGEYLIIASTPNSADTVFQIWGWDGEPEDEPVLLNASIPLVAEGVWARSTRRPNRSATATKLKSCRTTVRRPGTAPAPKTPKRDSRQASRRISVVCCRSRSRHRYARTAESRQRRQPQQRRLHDEMEAGADAAGALHAPAPERRKRRVDDGRQQPQQARIHLQTGVRRDLELPRQGEQRNRGKRLLGQNPWPSRSTRRRLSLRPPTPNPAPRLLRQRRLVQGHRDRLLHLQWGSEPRRR